MHGQQNIKKSPWNLHKYDNSFQDITQNPFKVASTERSFSKLKIKRNYIRSTYSRKGFFTVIAIDQNERAKTEGIIT